MTGQENPFGGGECVSCGRGTDTGFVVVGEAEFHASFLVALGLANDEAGGTVSIATGRQPGIVPAGIFEAFHRVCRACVRRNETRLPDQLPDPGVFYQGATVPVVRQRSEPGQERSEA
jgi:hypothetical protein